LGAAALLGGDVATHVASLVIVAVLGSWLLGLALFHGGLGQLVRLPILAQLFLALVLLIPFGQLVPLAPAWWHALPGRALPLAVLQQVGLADQWRPLTLDTVSTALAAAASLWMAGLVLAVILLPSDRIRQLFLLIFMLGLINIAIGMGQIASRGEAFSFYSFTHYGSLIGVFSNKNHTGLFLALSILAGYAVLRRDQFRDRRVLMVVGPVLLVFLAALIATFSRAGLLLGVIATAVASVLTFEVRLGKAGRVLGLSALALGGLLAVFASTDLAAGALGRFSAVSDDVRWTFWTRSWPLVHAYFPAGGGLGSFPTLFAVSERLDWLKPTYLNHAHNDYLEFLIEAGAAAVLVVAVALAGLVVQLVRAWRDRPSREGRQALIGGAMVSLCAVHSVFDYPLRRIAIAAVFFFAWAVLQRVGLDEKAIADND
jgi:O-antigen ligase